MTIILILISINFIFFLKKKSFDLRTKKNLFFYDKKQLIYSYFFFFFIFFTFFIFFRVFRILMPSSSIDLKKINLFFLLEYNILLILLFIILFFSLKSYLFTILKFHYLRLYFYSFFRSMFFRFLIKFIPDIELKIYLYNKKLYLVFIFFKQYLFHILVFFFFLKNLIFDNAIINLFFLPYYGLYYSILKMDKFLRKMNYDFDLGMVQCYYPDNFCVCLSGFYKLYLYHLYLFEENKSFLFKESNLFELNSNIPKNWLIYQYPFNFNLNFVFEKKQVFINKSLIRYLLVNFYK